MMVEARLKLALAAKQKNVEAGQWYMAGPTAGGESALEDKPFDAGAVDAEGVAIWKKTDAIKDGQISEITSTIREIRPVYFYCRIHAQEAMTLHSGFGSRNALEVWLNGEKVLASTKERKARKDEHIVDLNLKAGFNELLIRVFSWKGKAQLYFALQVDPQVYQWRQLKRQFATQCGWMEKDIGVEQCKAWLGERKTSEIEKKMVEAALKGAEPFAEALRKEAVHLEASDTRAGDKGWLDLYMRTCRLRGLIAEVDVEKARLTMLRRAAERIAQIEKSPSQWLYVYIKRIEGLGRRIDAITDSLDDYSDSLNEKLGSIKSAELMLLRKLIIAQAGDSSGAFVLNAEQYADYVSRFNADDAESIVNFIPNAVAWEWMRVNMPLFECPDKKFEQIYYYRWWTFRKHIKQTEDGYVLTEFLDQVGHSGKHNTISCALGHHIYEGRWLRDQTYLDDHARFWFRDENGKPRSHFHRYSNWTVDALYNRYLVSSDKDYIVELLDDFVVDFAAWQKERGVANGLFWQYDVLDGGEESISGSRHERNVRPTINSYMYANAIAIAKTAEMAGKSDLAKEYWTEAMRIKSLMQNLLWDGDMKFFKAMYEAGGLCDAREAIGYIPWFFNLPDAGYEQAWLQINDDKGFKAPMGLTTAERRHPAFRSHGVGTCEWDGAVWPYATTQTLGALANVLRNYEQNYVTRKDYFEHLLTYARSHNRDGKPYIGEYLDEVTGQWLTPDSDRSRFYNHSAFCDLVISGLVGLVPRADNTVEVEPLVPEGTWDWFCLDNVRYHARNLTILWDKTGNRYGKGPGLHVYADGKQIVWLDRLGKVTARLPKTTAGLINDRRAPGRNR